MSDDNERSGDGGHSPESGAHEDGCYVCGQPGRLLCCDGCPAACHLACAGAPGSNNVCAQSLLASLHRCLPWIVHVRLASSSVLRSYVMPRWAPA